MSCINLFSLSDSEVIELFKRIAKNKYSDSILRTSQTSQLTIFETIQKSWSADTNAGSGSYFFGYFDICLIDNASKCELELDSNDVFISENYSNVSTFFGICENINITGNVNVNFSGYVIRIN